MKSYWWQRERIDRITLRICTGCGHRSDVPIKRNYMACCPDNNYKIVSIKPKIYYL